MKTFIARTCIWTFLVVASCCGTTVPKTVRTFVNILTNLTISWESRIAGAFVRSQSVSALCVCITLVSLIPTLINVVTQVSITQELHEQYPGIYMNSYRNKQCFCIVQKHCNYGCMSYTHLHLDIMFHFFRILQDRDNEKNQCCFGKLGYHYSWWFQRNILPRRDMKTHPLRILRTDMCNCKNRGYFCRQHQGCCYLHSFGTHQCLRTTIRFQGTPLSSCKCVSPMNCIHLQVAFPSQNGFWLQLKLVASVGASAKERRDGSIFLYRALKFSTADEIFFIISANFLDTLH